MNSCYPQMHEVPHSLTVSTPPEEEPVSLAEVKLHLHMETDFADEDSKLNRLIAAAREMVEKDCERALMPQTLTLKLDCFPSIIELRRCPVGDSEDIEIEYVDSDGDTQTLDPEDYRVDATSEPGRIASAYGTYWPTTQPVSGAVTVTFPAGYADADAVPAMAVQAICLLVGHWYRNAEAVGTVGTEVVLAYQALIQRLRWGGYI